MIPIPPAIGIQGKPATLAGERIEAFPGGTDRGIGILELADPSRAWRISVADWKR